MKLREIISLAILIIITTVVCILGINRILLKNKEKELLNIAESVIKNINEEKERNLEDTENDDVELINGIFGIIEIPTLNIKAPICDGTSQEILKNTVGHFKETSKDKGNIVLASHNRGNNVAHYFKDIKNLKMGDVIIYKTKRVERRYLVKVKKQIASTDWSVTKDTKENKITLITCIKNKPNLRLCIQAIEKK